MLCLNKLKIKFYYNYNNYFNYFFIDLLLLILYISKLHVYEYIDIQHI